MAAANPKSKASEITDRINAFGDRLKEGGSFDEMSWQRIYRDIEAIAKNPDLMATSLLLQAVLWELKYERDKVKAIFNSVAGRFGKSLQWYMTRANMAPTFGDTSLVMDMLEHGYPKDSRAGLKKVVTMCSHAGMFSSACKALNDLIALDERHGSVLESAFPFLRPASSYMAANDIPELEVADRIVTASKIVIDHGYRLTKYAVRIDGSGLLYEFVLDAEIEPLIELNFAISDAIALGFEGTLSHHLSVGVIPKEEASQHAG